jgi:primosomal protein N' (replication factor Y)
MVLLVYVALRSATLAFDRPFTYYVPKEQMPEVVLPGMRVLVPFGRGNKSTQGIILKTEESDRRDNIKPVLSFLDAEPVISPENLRLALWMRDKYYCTCYDAVRCFLPPGIDLKEKSLYSALEEDLPVNLSEAEENILSFLKNNGPQTSEALSAAFPTANVPVLLRRMEKAGLVKEQVTSRPAVSGKTVKCVRLCEGAIARSNLTKRQKDVVEYLRSEESAPVKDVCYFTGVTQTTINAMEKKGLLESFEQEVFRPAYMSKGEFMPEDITLSDEQQKAFTGLSALLAEKKPAAALLMGVTGSGKTLVYMKLIEQVLEAGRGALVLVPEIALTPQLLERFYRQFGSRVALLHSSLSAGERYDEWKRIQSGQADVVIGTRLAVFAPVPNLGLVVLDEEQEDTYYSGQTPKYHARDVAKFRAVQHEALLLLISATPSMESIYAAKEGRYALFTLKNRYAGGQLPSVSFVDMKKELSSGRFGTISGPLYEALAENMEKKQQSILFINRRGWSRTILCQNCGATPTCKHCSVAMTYHRANRRLMCHYCGYSAPEPTLCPSCHSRHLSKEGTGTQKVAAELAVLFPGVEILRMDADTTGGKQSHEQILQRFKEENIPILLGTQMIAKGLDFPNVTLVGVLDADQALHSIDFRARERAFSRLTQVVGRAGRGEVPGRAFIQTFQPEHPVLLSAAAQDYIGFYESEIAFRKALSYPPFCDLLRFSVSDETESRAADAAAALRAAAAYTFGEEGLIGPAPAPIYKVNNRYRLHIYLKTQENATLRSKVSALLIAFLADRKYRGISFAAEINPLD